MPYAILHPEGHARQHQEHRHIQHRSAARQDRVALDDIGQEFSLK